MTHRTVRGDDLDIAVFERGDPASTTVVLVHGFPDTHAVWDGVAEHLAQEFHVVSYDVRGAGASGRPTSRAGYDFDHLVADLAAVVDAVSPDAPVHLVGHDWGSIQSWEAVLGGTLDGRLASFTSMSGPSLEHVSRWMRARRSLRPSLLRPLLRQGARSWYTAAFQLPKLPELIWRTVMPGAFRRYLQRTEGVSARAMPGPTLPRDAANGVQLYRQNMRRRSPGPASTDLPVQLIVPVDDRFVTPDLLDDVHLHVPNLHRRDVAGGHWLLAVEPERVAGWIADHVREVDAAS